MRWFKILNICSRCYRVSQEETRFWRSLETRPKKYLVHETDLSEFVGGKVQVVEIAEAQRLGGDSVFAEAETMDTLHVQRKLVRVGEGQVTFRTRASHLTREEGS